MLDLESVLSGSGVVLPEPIHAFLQQKNAVGFAAGERVFLLSEYAAKSTSVRSKEASSRVNKNSFDYLRSYVARFKRCYTVGDRVVVILIHPEAVEFLPQQGVTRYQIPDDEILLVCTTLLQELGDNWRSLVADATCWPSEVVACLSSPTEAWLLKKGEVVFRAKKIKDQMLYEGLYPRLILSDFPAPHPICQTLQDAKRYAGTADFEAPSAFCCVRLSETPSVITELPFCLYKQLREHDAATDDQDVFADHWRERYVGLWSCHTSIFGPQKTPALSLEQYLQVPYATYGVDQTERLLNPLKAEIAAVIMHACERAVAEQVDRTPEASFLVPLQVARKLNLLKGSSKGGIKMRFSLFCMAFADEIDLYNLHFCFEKGSRKNADLYYAKLGKEAKFEPKNNTELRAKRKDFADKIEQELLVVIKTTDNGE